MPPRRVFHIPTPAIPPPTRHARSTSCSSDEGYSSSTPSSTSPSRPVSPPVQQAPTKHRRCIELRTKKRDRLYLNGMVKKNNGSVTLEDFSDIMRPLHMLQYVEHREKKMIDQHEKFNAFLDDDTLDLHYLTVPLALKMLKKKIKKMENGEYLHVCTGAGNGSQIRGHCVIKLGVLRHAKENNIKCEEMRGNPGVLIFSL